ncbi:MAG: hypothetical protein HOV87_32110 [Catenulispora sp.]|nr:hypothetical protein [Catenulispora sp.]
MTGILAGTQWHPADTPQEATQTAREARDLAVRLRPVLSKLAQAPRGGRRRDLDWLPAVEQLAVDAQYFASWWLPRLEGKSAQSWPSWSADGYADWVKRLDAQRVRTLEMVQGTTPPARIASVTQLRRGKGTDATPDTGAPQAPEAPEISEVPEVPEAPRMVPPPETSDSPSARHARGKDTGERTARIMPIRGAGAPVIESAPAATTTFNEFDDSPAFQDSPVFEDSPVFDEGPLFDDSPVFDDSPAFGDADETHVSHATPIIELEDFDHEAPHEAPPEVLPEEPPRVPRTPPFTGPDTFDDVVTPAAPDADLLLIPRTPPNKGPAEDPPLDDRLTDDADATHISRRPPEAAPDIDEGRRPLFRDEPYPSGVGAVGALGALSAVGAAEELAEPDRRDGPEGPDEFEYFQPGDDRPPPVFAQSPPTEPVDRARIARYAIAAVLFAAACVFVFSAVNQKHSDKTATPPTTSASTSPAGAAGSKPADSPSPSTSQSSVSSGAVTAPTEPTAPTATDSSTPAPPPSSPPVNNPPPPPATSSAAPPSTTSHSSAAAPTTSAAAPPPASPSSKGPAGGSGASGVSSLSVGSLAADQTGSYTYTAHVHVVAKGTGAVTVTVTMGGSQSSTSPGGTGAQSASYPLSGKTSYDITASFDVHGMCPSPYIDVVVSASGASSAAAYTTSPC